MDRFDHIAALALERSGLEPRDGQRAVEEARVIKFSDEIICMKLAIAVCEAGMTRMRDRLQPGLTENELWSYLHQTNIELGGEWM